MQPDFLTTPYRYTARTSVHCAGVKPCPTSAPCTDAMISNRHGSSHSGDNRSGKHLYHWWRKEFRRALQNQEIELYDGETLKMRCDMERANTYQSVKHERETRVFGKSKSCPSCYQLLNYYRDCQTQDASRASSVSNLTLEHTALHLATCDFCSAEFELLLHHPPADTAASIPDCEPKSVPMPAHLYALAHTLLFNSPAPHKTFFFSRDGQQSALTIVDNG